MEELNKSHQAWLEERAHILDELYDAKNTIEQAIKFIKQGEM